MNDIQFFFSIISLFIGVGAISISSFIYMSNRKKTLRFFIGLNISLFLIQNAITLIIYATNVGKLDSFITILSKCLDMLGTSFSSLFGILLINALLGKEITRIKKIIVGAVFTFQLIGILICNMNDQFVTLKYVLQLSIILVIIYEIFMIILNYRQIGNKELKIAIKVFMLITIVFFPLFIFELVREYIPWLRNIFFLKMLSLPAFFIAINIYAMIFANRYFNSPPYIEKNRLTAFFIQRYNITEKEIEVIELILDGLTYKQIAEKLFIANKTVDNHVQNIYKKLEVTSKIQLSNLIRSKE